MALVSVCVFIVCFNLCVCAGADLNDSGCTCDIVKTSSAVHFHVLMRVKYKHININKLKNISDEMKEKKHFIDLELGICPQLLSLFSNLFKRAAVLFEVDRGFSIFANI